MTDQAHPDSIVFVHGLNPKGSLDHARRTWTPKNSRQTFWPEDLLPTLVPTARVLLLSYNSAALINASNSTVGDHALTLLEQLQGLRGRETQHHPIVFICHSLGGLVVKQALVTAKLNDRYLDIVTSTAGIVFFGTPHRGGNGASIADFASRALASCTGDSPSTLLPALRKKSIFSSTLSEQFHTMSHNYRFISFFEQLPSSLKIKRYIIKTRLTQMVIRHSRYLSWYLQTPGHEPGSNCLC